MITLTRPFGHNRTQTLFLGLALLAGCDGTGGRDTADSGATDGSLMRLTYRNDPLADVQVRLHAAVDGPVIAQAVSAADGFVRFHDPPEPPPTTYYVSLASLGDGGWMLDPKFIDPRTSGVTLTSDASNGPTEIRIPSNAVRPLLGNRRR